MQSDPQVDSGAKIRTTSYADQYNRVLDDVAPFQGVDYDIVAHANVLEENAAAQANRREQPATDDVER